MRAVFRIDFKIIKRLKQFALFALILTGLGCAPSDPAVLSPAEKARTQGRSPRPSGEAPLSNLSRPDQLFAQGHFFSQAKFLLLRRAEIISLLKMAFLWERQGTAGLADLDPCFQPRPEFADGLVRRVVFELDCQTRFSKDLYQAISGQIRFELTLGTPRVLRISTVSLNSEQSKLKLQAVSGRQSHWVEESFLVEMVQGDSEWAIAQFLWAGRLQNDRPELRGFDYTIRLKNQKITALSDPAEAALGLDPMQWSYLVNVQLQSRTSSGNPSESSRENSGQQNSRMSVRIELQDEVEPISQDEERFQVSCGLSGYSAQMKLFLNGNENRMKLSAQGQELMMQFRNSTDRVSFPNLCPQVSGQSSRLQYRGPWMHTPINHWLR